MNFALTVLRFLLAGVFLYAGLVKSLSSAEFALALIPFTIIPAAWIGTIARVLPLAEIGAAVLLLLPGTRRLGALAIGGLCLLFIAALGWALANGIIVSCSCFGKDEAPSAMKMALALGRDVLLALAALAVFLPPTRSRRPRRERGDA